MKSSGIVLFACSGLLLSGGAILGGATAWCLLRFSYYFWTTDLGLELGSGVLFITGALLCLPACWLCTIVPYHTKSHPLMAVLMSLVGMSMLLLSLGLSTTSALSQAVRDPAKVNASMHQAMANTINQAVKSSFAAMQLETQCCGVNSYADWYRYDSSLPPSCCGRVPNGKREEQCKVPLSRNGCLTRVLVELRTYINSITTIASAVIVVLGVTLFTVAYLVVTSVLERSEVRYKAQPMRIACLAQAPLMSLGPTVQTTPFVPLTPQSQVQPAPALI